MMKEKNKKDEIVIMMISFFINEMIENGIATIKKYRTILMNKMISNLKK